MNPVRSWPLPDHSYNLDTAYSVLCQLPHSLERSLFLVDAVNLPTWDNECDQRYNAFLLAASCVDSHFKTEELTSCLNRKRWERWIESLEGIYFTHSSRKAWRTLNRLTGCRVFKEAPWHCQRHRSSAPGQRPLRWWKQESLSQCETAVLCGIPGVDGHLTSPFTS